MAEHTTSAGLDAPVSVAEFSLRIHADKQYRLRVALPECLVGRAPQAHIRIPHPLVAPRHCRLFWNKRQLWVEALQGEVALDRRPLNQALLRPGDLLQLGPVGLEILSIRPPAAGAEPSPCDRRESAAAAAEESHGPTPADSWWERFSQRLDHIEQLCRQLRSEESALADLFARLERIEEQLARHRPEQLLEEMLAPLQRRLQQLQRRYRRLYRRLNQWWQQQGAWQQQLDQQSLSWDTQARQLDHRLRQMQQSINQTQDDHRQLVRRMSQLQQAETGDVQQAVVRAVEQATEPLLQQVEHLERRFRELEQWTRCLRRELRGEMHSEVESRLADLRAEREALETLRQNPAAPAGTMPVTAPGVGFPVAREKSESSAKEEETSPAPSASAVHCDQEVCDQEVQQAPESEPPSAPAEADAGDCRSQLPETEDDSPAPAADVLASPPEEPKRADLVQADRSDGAEPPEAESGRSTAAPPAEAEQEVPEQNARADAGSDAQQATAGDASFQPESSAQETPPLGSESHSHSDPAGFEPGCQLSTVELFRRLGIEVPGLETETPASPSPAGPPPDTESAAQSSSTGDASGTGDETSGDPAPPMAEGGNGTAVHESGSADDSQHVPAAATFDGESVEDYMTRLLQSIDPKAAVVTSESAPVSEAETPADTDPPAEAGWEETPAPVQSHAEPGQAIEVDTQALKAAPGSLPAALDDSPKDPAARVTPAESPETLHSLRRLANTSARTAIETYQRRLKLSATQTKLLLSVLAMLASFAMMWFAGTVPHKWVYAAALVSLGISIYYGLRYLVLTAQTPGGEDDLLEEEE